MAHLRAGWCKRKCCQAENHTSHRRAWTGGMAPTVYQCGHVRSLATRLRTRRRGGTVACTCVCMRDESAIIARGVLRQYEYRCFLILGRHPLVLYVSLVLARRLGRMRGQVHRASVPRVGSERSPRCVRTLSTSRASSTYSQQSHCTRSFPHRSSSITHTQPCGR